MQPAFGREGYPMMLLQDVPKHLRVTQRPLLAE